MKDIDTILPDPPQFPHSRISIPKYLSYSDSTTRWMINLLRHGTDYRLSSMLQQKPNSFAQLYQIPDSPSTFHNEKSDNTPMFHKSTVLYLNALCMGIYMRKLKAVQLILHSGINTPQQCCYATYVFTRGSRSGGDIMEVMPMCIAIRREFFLAIPLLVNTEQNKKLSAFSPFTPRTKICINYVNRDKQRVFRYTDCINYATDTLKKMGNFPLARFLDKLLLECAEYFPPTQLEQTSNSRHSLFRRLARVAYNEDPNCRMTLQLIQCLDVLLRYRCVPWLYTEQEGIEKFNLAVSGKKDFIMDQYSSVGLLLALYSRILTRSKNGLLAHLGDLIFKALIFNEVREKFISVSNQDLHNMFMELPEKINISEDAILLVKRHIEAVLKFEKERDLRLRQTYSQKPSKDTINSTGVIKTPLKATVKETDVVSKDDFEGFPEAPQLTIPTSPSVCSENTVTESLQKYMKKLSPSSSPSSYEETACESGVKESSPKFVVINNVKSESKDHAKPSQNWNTQIQLNKNIVNQNQAFNDAIWPSGDDISQLRVPSSQKNFMKKDKMQIPYLSSQHATRHSSKLHHHHCHNRRQQKPSSEEFKNKTPHWLNRKAFLVQNSELDILEYENSVLNDLYSEYGYGNFCPSNLGGQLEKSKNHVLY